MHSHEAAGDSIFTEEFTRNPYPTYARLRETDPIARMVFPDGQTGWMITRYEDAVEALRDQRLIKDISKIIGEQDANESIFTHNMLFADPPDHHRLRGLVQRAFTPRMINGMRDRIQEITDELLDAVADKKEMDLIDCLAFPLPIIVICEMLGIPAEDRDKFRLWSNTLIEGSNGEQQSEKMALHMQAFIEYLGGRFAHVRENPGQDLISQLISAEDAGDSLTEKELYGVVSLLIIAGHETTVNMIGNTVLNLLEHPEQLKRLQENPDLIHAALEESIRYDGPVEFSTARWAGENFEFKGKAFNTGEVVIVALNSANRDPEIFTDPETFDISREKKQHLAFGSGIHFCLGSTLARLEVEIVINTLLHRFPNIKLNVDPDTLKWRSGMIVRGVEELPVSL